jgi:hypothetical protein
VASRDNILDRELPVIWVRGIIDPVKLDNVVLGVRKPWRKRLACTNEMLLNHDIRVE